jgi:ATPase subunit of ABC transporter with duplicated ATPase domains
VYAYLILTMQLLETVKLGDVRAARSLSALSPSQQCRVQFASILLKNPDVILFDNPTDATHGLSHDDIEDLKAFIKGFGNTCIVDSADEDFLSAVSSAVLVVDTKLAGQSGAKLFRESYAAVKSQLSVKTRESHFDKTGEFKSDLVTRTAYLLTSFLQYAAKMQEASAQRSAMLHSDETDRALNELAFQNVASSVSQEEYIKVMLLIMALHPPALLGMYYMGLFDAII